MENVKHALAADSGINVWFELTMGCELTNLPSLDRVKNALAANSGLNFRNYPVWKKLNMLLQLTVGKCLV